MSIEYRPRIFRTEPDEQGKVCLRTMEGFIVARDVTCRDADHLIRCHIEHWEREIRNK